MRIRAFSLSALLVVTLAWPAHASTFTLSPDLPGLTFTIENLGLASEDLYAADGVDDTYAILFGLETTTAYADAGALADLFAAFALDFGDSAVEGAALVSSPSAYSWSLKSNEKVPGNSAKCNGSETGGVCVEEAASATGNLVLDANATYSWLFHVDLGTGGFTQIAAGVTLGEEYGGASASYDVWSNNAGAVVAVEQEVSVTAGSP